MEKEWYVVNTYSGHENKVKEKLEMRASIMGMEDVCRMENDISEETLQALKNLCLK